MKTIVTLDIADQPYGFPQLNGNGNFNSVIVESGLTANTLVLSAITESLADENVLSVNNAGIVHTYPISGLTGVLSTSGITSSAATLNFNTDYLGVNFNGNVDLTLPSPVGYDGYNLIVKDEGGYSSTYRIRLTPLSGLIDGNTYVDMNLNYIALHLIARNNNWWLI